MDAGWLERDGVRLRWRQWGPASARPVFCLHGLRSNSLYWTRLADRLPDHHVVAIDQRSHGQSGRPDSGYTFADLTGDALFAVDQLELDRPLVLGHSWGAAVAQALVAGHRERFAGLGHLDGILRSFSKLMSWDQASVLMQPPLRHYADLAEAVAEQKTYLETGWGDDLADFVQAGLVEDGAGFALTLTAEVRLQILLELYAFDPEQLWPALQRVPVLIAVAQQGPPPILSWKEQSVQEVARLLPDADIRWFPSAHDIPLHLPDEVAAAVRELYDRVPAA